MRIVLVTNCRENKGERRTPRKIILNLYILLGSHAKQGGNTVPISVPVGEPTTHPARRYRLFCVGHMVVPEVKSLEELEVGMVDDTVGCGRNLSPKS